MQANIKNDNKAVRVSNGKIIYLDYNNPEDLQFAREAYGYKAEEQGWFRERDRLFVFSGALNLNTANAKLRGQAPPSILDVPAPPKPDGPVSQKLFTMDDGTIMRWIRHPSALPKSSRKHWRNHTALFELKGKNPDFVCYTSIHSFGVIDGADGKFRIIGPGGIRWINYPNQAAAISDALDMSLAVAMKIQVVQTPNAGIKISVYGDISNKPKVLKSIFAAYERLGFIATSADLGLSLDDLEKYALPVAPTTIVPMGVYKDGIPSALVTADACLPAIQAMAESLPDSPPLNKIIISLQGIGEVGYLLAQYLIEKGARVIIAETDAQTRDRFKKENSNAFSSNQAEFLNDPNKIYDVPADIFCPCALRDILEKRNLSRLLKARIRIIGGPANNLFPDQIEGPWLFHKAGIPVVPYEGIGAGGVTGVAYSVMAGIFGKCPFTIPDKIELIKNYVAKILHWSQRYDLPPQVISDRILFLSTKRRNLFGQQKADLLLEELRRAFNGGNRDLEDALVNEYTKKGFFYGPGRHRKI
jgi:leucine dehydrogenase